MEFFNALHGLILFGFKLMSIAEKWFDKGTRISEGYGGRQHPILASLSSFGLIA
jgi:hypothetical protein